MEGKRHLSPWQHRWRAFLAACLFVPFAVTGTLVTVSLAVIALWEIGSAIVQFWWPIGSGHKDHDPLGALVIHVLKGVELLFLAPLAYLIVLTLGDYLRCVATRSSETAKVHDEVLEIKSLSASLLIAVVATDLIQKILSADGLTWNVALSEGLVVAVLTIYLVVLQRRPKVLPI